MNPPPVTAAPLDAGRQGHYAGGVTRLVAFAADVGASWGIFTLALAGLSFAINLVNAWFKAATETDGVTPVTNQSEVAALEEMPLAEVLFGGRDGEGKE